MTGATLHSPGSRSAQTNQTSAAPNSRAAGRRSENQVGDSARGIKAPDTSTHRTLTERTKSNPIYKRGKKQARVDRRVLLTLSRDLEGSSIAIGAREVAGNGGEVAEKGEGRGGGWADFIEQS
jgi:hypothetical protein